MARNTNTNTYTMFYDQPEHQVSERDRTILVHRAMRGLFRVYKQATELPLPLSDCRRFVSIQADHHHLPVPGKFITTAPQIHQYLRRKARYIPLSDWPVQHLIKLIRDCRTSDLRDRTIPTQNVSIHKTKPTKILSQQRIFYQPTLSGLSQLTRIHEENAHRYRGESPRAQRTRQRQERRWRQTIIRQTNELEHLHSRGRARAERIRFIQQENRAQDDLEVAIVLKEFAMDGVMNIIGSYSLS